MCATTESHASIAHCWQCPQGHLSTKCVDYLEDWGTYITRCFLMLLLSFVDRNHHGKAWIIIEVAMKSNVKWQLDANLEVETALSGNHWESLGFLSPWSKWLYSATKTFTSQILLITTTDSSIGMACSTRTRNPDRRNYHCHLLQELDDRCLTLLFYWILNISMKSCSSVNDQLTIVRRLEGRDEREPLSRFRWIVYSEWIQTNGDHRYIWIWREGWRERTVRR